MTESAFGYCGMPCALCTRCRTTRRRRIKANALAASTKATARSRVHHTVAGIKLLYYGACEGFPCVKCYLCELFIRQVYETLEKIMRRAEILSGSPKKLEKTFQELAESLCVPTGGE